MSVACRTIQRTIKRATTFHQTQGLFPFAFPFPSTVKIITKRTMATSPPLSRATMTVKGDIPVQLPDGLSKEKLLAFKPFNVCFPSPFPHMHALTQPLAHPLTHSQHRRHTYLPTCLPTNQPTSQPTNTPHSTGLAHNPNPRTNAPTQRQSAPIPRGPVFAPVNRSAELRRLGEQPQHIARGVPEAARRRLQQRRREPAGRRVSARIQRRHARYADSRRRSRAWWCRRWEK